MQLSVVHVLVTTRADHGSTSRSVPALCEALDAERLAVTILDTTASGRPVVSTACSGPSTSVLNGVTVRLVPVGDAEALPDALQEILSALKLADVMGHRGRERVEEHFSMDATGQRFLDTYANLVDDSGS